MLPTIWFRSNLRGRSRDWNWHNTIGFWCAVPLFFVVLSGVIMSYQGANNLLYQLTGSQPPALPPANNRVSQNHSTQHALGTGELLSADELLARVKQQSPGWKSISFRMPTPRDRTIIFTADAGNGGQPQKKSQLTLDRKTGALIRTEDFSTYNLGRKLRFITRFLHTGEILGLPGQLIATLVSLGAAFLVWTGLALSVRRFNAWRSRREKADTVIKRSEQLPV